MDRMLYIAMSGLKQVMQAQAINSHNLANVSTPGFKADLQAFRDVQVHGPALESRSYSAVHSNGFDNKAGSIVNTGNDLDIAVKGDGFIAVQSSTGQEAYTRAGSMHITPNGQLMNAAGYPVLGNGGPITIPPSSKVEIGNDGTVSVVPLGQEANALAVIDRIKLVKPDATAINKGNDGLFYLAENAVAELDGTVQVVSGAVESSNVNVVDAMVNMIDLARSYEMQSKMMKKSEENDSSSAKLLSLG